MSLSNMERIIIRCPDCNHKSRVLSTSYKKSMTIRQRLCLNKGCKNKFVTKEVYEDSPNYYKKYQNLVKKLEKLINE